MKFLRVVTVLNGPHRLSDRVKHKLISEIKDAAIYKDLDRLKDITRHVCRVLSKKSKTKSPSASALDFQEEIVDISRPFHNRSLRQAEANNVEATITNDHIKTFKCQRCLSNDHSTVLCPASDPSGSVCSMSLPDERTYHVHEVFRPRPFCSGLSSQGAETDGIGPMPVEQRKMIFDRVKAKRTPTTTTVKDSQVSLVALSTSKTRSDSSLTNIDIYLNTEKLRYKRPALGKDANSFASPGTSKTLKMMETILTECSSGLLKPSTISSLGRGLAVEKIVEGSVEGSFSDFSLGTAKLAGRGRVFAAHERFNVFTNPGSEQQAADGSGASQENAPGEEPQRPTVPQAYLIGVYDLPRPLTVDDVPPSWAAPALIPKDRYGARFCDRGVRIEEYHKAAVEPFSPYTQPDSMVERVTRFEDLKLRLPVTYVTSSHQRYLADAAVPEEFNHRRAAALK
ncbi:hypothetical protein FOZ60_010667, partial [Perkinsus olseni]